MKDDISIRAQTVEEAIRLALEHLGLPREEVDVQVLEEPGSGENGLEEALVRVTRKGAVLTAAAPRAPEEGGDPLAVGQEVLDNLLRCMGMQAQVAVGSYALIPGEDQAILEVTTETEHDSGLLIGRRGDTLHQLQFLVNLLVSRRLHQWPYLLVDVEQYRRRRDVSLGDLARRMAQRVIESKKPFTLEPMPPYERRVVHIALRDDPQVITQSAGEGDSRKVVIYPRGWDLPQSLSS